MQRLSVVLVVACLAAGCASSLYERQPWAGRPFEQASAECYTEINQRGGPPNYYLCMRAKGWFEVNQCKPGVQCASER